MTSSDQENDASAIDDVKMTETPPHTIGGILGRLGPGLIIAGSIVGSGELIATTETGAKAGFWLLWLILIGCVIKVFVQVEMGRYTIVSGKTPLDALSEVPGPRIEGRGNWLIWYWALVFLATIGQVGGIVGGVGQSLQISVPLTDAGRQFNTQLDAETAYRVAVAQLGLAERRADEAEPKLAKVETHRSNRFLPSSSGSVPKLWQNEFPLRESKSRTAQAAMRRYCRRHLNLSSHGSRNSATNPNVYLISTPTGASRTS